MNEMRKLMETIEQINEGSDEEWGHSLNNFIVDGDQEYLSADYSDEAQEVWKSIRRELQNMWQKQYNESVGETDDIRYDPQSGDDEPLEYDDTPGATKYIRRYGSVTVKFDEGEVLLTHGHGENIFLTMEEWKEFAGEIQDIFV